MIEDPDRCYQAAQSKDARFDGWFFCAVTSTGIYCRPSCPARTPKRENVRFYPTAAAAQQAGFRACLRCRPDATPGSPEWNVRADVVARAMRLIRDGIVDREGVEGLAGRLGYSTRQLNRLVTAEVGTGPLAIARAQRSQTARILLETTDLPVAHVAFAAGFASVRQCNDTVRQIFADTPSGPAGPRRGPPPARGRRASAGGGAPRPSGSGSRAGARSAPRRCSTFLGLRALPGVESLDGSSYRRSLRLPHGHGIVTLRAPEGAGDGADERSGPSYVEGELVLSDLRDLHDRRVALPPAARPRRRPRRRLGGPARRRARRARSSSATRAPGARRRRRLRARRARRDRPAGLGARGPHGRRPARAGGGRPAARRRRHDHPPLPDAGRARRAGRPRPGRLRHAGGTAPCPGRAGRGGRARRRRDRPGRRPGRAAPLAGARCPASGPGRPSTWPCARCATPTRSCRPTSASGGRPGPSACPTTRPASWPLTERWRPVAQLRHGAPVVAARRRPHAIPTPPLKGRAA